MQEGGQADSGWDAKHQEDLLKKQKEDEEKKAAGGSPVPSPDENR
jgi:hypothetical protein